MIFPENDPRVVEWPFMGGATSSNLILVAYFLFIKVLGPSYMKNRQPYKLTALLFFYNFGLVVYSAWMFYKFSKYGWLSRYRWICEPVNPDDRSEEAMEIAYACWHFFMSKLVELLDTIFFVLRKKNSQVTFLHVTHHILAVFQVRYNLSHGAGGYNTMFGFVNTFVHIWMYSYYALAALGPGIQKYLWWKKYITTLQMIQFIFVTGAMIFNSFLDDCDTNEVLIAGNLLPAIFFLVLFSDFYRSTYSKKRTQRATDGNGHFATSNNDRISEAKRRA